VHLTTTSRPRRSATGLITAVCFAVFSVLSRVYMPAVMTTDAERYGLIGAAFGMVSWLFAAALLLVVTAALGARWGDLDAMTIGEEWLRAMLALRLPEHEADAAAAGWDGGGYRAFSDGDHVVVVLRTAWDSDADAAAFAAALRGWSSAAGDVGGHVGMDVAGTSVTAVFGDAQGPLQTAIAALR